MIIEPMSVKFYDLIHLLGMVDSDMEHVANLPEVPEESEEFVDYFQHLVSHCAMKFGANLSDVFVELDRLYGGGLDMEQGTYLEALAHYNEALAHWQEEHLLHHDCPSRQKTEDVIRISRAQAAIMREFDQAFKNCQQHFQVLMLKELHRGQDINPEDAE